jgi:hypothetical protein
MHTSHSTYREDRPDFRRGGSPNTYWLGSFITLHMNDAELHELRLRIDQVDDVVNGPMK